MAQFDNIFPVDLENGPSTVTLKTMYSNNKKANRVGFKLTKKGQPVTIEGSCVGTAILSNNTTVPIDNGIVSGNEAYVVLPDACYSMPGPVTVYVTIVNSANGETATLLAAAGYVRITETDTIIDPGTILPSVTTLIDLINEAVSSIPADYSALLAAIAPTFSTSGNYALGDYVWHSGKLYRFSVPHAPGSWTGSDAIEYTATREYAAIRSSLETKVPQAVFDFAVASIAPEFSSTTDYTAGQWVWRSGRLYRFTADHAAGEWSGTDAVQAVLANNLAERIDNLDASMDIAQSSLDTMNELPSTATETNGKYLKTNRTIGTTLGDIVVPSSNWNFLQFPVSAGDRFLVTGTGGADPLVWAFSDAGTDPDATEWSEKGCKLVSKGGRNTTLTNALIVAPVDGWALINHKLSDPFSLRTLQAQPLAQQIASLTGMHGIKRLTDYGAVGDGATDDTAAIKAALTACAGDTLYVPPGTYLFSETLDIESGTRIIGFGATSKFKLANTFSLTPYPWRTGDPLVSDQYRYPMICMDTDTEGIILENFALEGQTNAFYDKNCDGLTIRGKNHIARNLVITKINFFPADFAGRTNNGVGRGINVQDASTVFVENCAIDDCGYECIGVENADNATIQNCICTHALQVTGQIHRNATNIRMIGNTFDNTDRQHTGSSSAGPGFTLHASTDYPMGDIMIDNNYIKSALVFANGGGENNIKITNNRIMGGISLNATTGWRNRCTVIGNSIGAQLNLKSDNAIIAGNMVYHAGGGYMINASGNNVVCYGNIALNSTTTAIKVANHDGTSATASNMRQIGIAADGTPIT